MQSPAPGIREILVHLEARYGLQQPHWPTEPYHFLVWWHCGYPASDVACAKGWHALKSDVGIDPLGILQAGADRLAKALRAGGMVPELRATRLLEIAARVQNEYCGDLRLGLGGPLTGIRQALKRFPNIADPGADRIMLFCGIAPLAAVPSNCPHVLVRIRLGRERESYSVTYREAQELLEAETAPSIEVRQHAYLLLKQHGQTLCKRLNPKCNECPVVTLCAFASGKHRGRD